jgi:ribosomal protein S18 acetylase RimI-like enzyme
MTVRNATPDDFDAVQSLYRQLLEYESRELGRNVNPEFAQSDYGVECLKGFVANTVGTMAIVYEDENGVIRGYASLRDVPELEVAHRHNTKQCELETMCVDHSCRDKGIGRQLVEECKRIAIVNGYNNFKTVALVNNNRAKKMYQSCGFKDKEIILEMEL